jgi:hypothetical protein
MAVTRPVMFTEVTDAETTFTRPVSEETVRKIVQNVNMLRALTPLAEIRAVHINLQGATVPSTTNWQYCDGAEITSATSPLNQPFTQNVPDMQNRYLRGANEGVLAGNEAAGNATADLSHAHGTGGNLDHPGNLLEGGDEVAGQVLGHTHGVNDDLSDSEPLELAHLQIAFYMRIQQ